VVIDVLFLTKISVIRTPSEGVCPLSTSVH
jgi:hypothetical protein